MSHAHLLDKYAELTIRAGLNLRAGQQLLITAPLEAVDLVRRVTHHAYKAGAALVTTIYSDEPAMYSVVYLNGSQITVHSDAFMNRSPAQMAEDAERGNWS